MSKSLAFLVTLLGIAQAANVESKELPGPGIPGPAEKTDVEISTWYPDEEDE